MKREQHYPDDWVPVSLAPDPVIDAYKPGIDITLLKKNLSLSIEQRIENGMAAQAVVQELRQAGIRMRAKANKA